MRLRMSRRVRSLGNFSEGWPWRSRPLAPSLPTGPCTVATTSVADRRRYEARRSHGYPQPVAGPSLRCASGLVRRSSPAANPLTRLVQSLQDRFASPPEASFGLTGLPLQSSVVTSAMNNRRWYPVSRLAPEQIKVLKHSMDPSMTVLLPGVETATAYGCKLVSYHRGGEDQSRVDLDLPVA